MTSGRLLRRPRPGLRLEMVLLTTGLLAAILVIGGAVFVHTLRTTLRDSAVQQARSHLADLVVNTEGGTIPGHPVARNAETLVQVVSDRGALLASSAESAAVVPLPRLAPGAAASYHRQQLPASEPGNDYLILARGVDGPRGRATIYVGLSVDNATEAADKARTLALTTLPALVVLIGVVTWFTVGRTLAPIERMRRSAESITARGLDRRVEAPDRDDEVGRLGHTLNTMLARLDAAQQSQRRFVADAAHELRSPVASIRAQLENQDPDHTPADWPRLQRDLTIETARMHRLVEALLLIARSDLSSLRPRFRLVDVDDLVVVAARRARIRSGVAISVSGVAPVQALLDPGLADQLLDNLLENATRHADRLVAVGLEGRHGQIEITVDDDGPGIPPDQRQAVFARFTRLDQARARTDGGAGLGLAIVQDIARAHTGSVEVGDSPLGGARFVVTLPAAPRAGVPSG